MQRNVQFSGCPYTSRSTKLLLVLAESELKWGLPVSRAVYGCLRWRFCSHVSEGTILTQNMTTSINSRSQKVGSIQKSNKEVLIKATSGKLRYV